jgi:two-component system response regulator RegA
MSGRLLLVDDDDTFRGVLSAALARRGYKVATAADAAEAIALAGGQRFDYAVVDLRMPGPSGLTVVEALVRDQPGIRLRQHRHGGGGHQAGGGALSHQAGRRR